MLNTTPISSLESITPDLLLAVSGGCGGCHHHGCCAPAGPVTQQTIVNMPQILPQAAPPAPAPSGDVVTTNVSVNGRPAA
ncbi:MAG TPA: hypothetical protein VF469_01320 [Kofleriaceae bacterium]